MAMVKLHAPASHTSCSFDGDEYKVEDGLVNVPQKAVAHLISHGFSTTKPELVAKLPVPIISLDEHETLKTEVAVQALDLKEKDGKIAALEAELAAAKKAAK